MLTLFCVPVICEPLIPHHPVKYREDYPHLDGLEFADDSATSSGHPHRFRLLLGRLQRSTDGPTAIQMNLGWGSLWTYFHSRPSWIYHSLVPHVLHMNYQSPETALNETMKSFWEFQTQINHFMMNSIIPSSSRKGDMKFHFHGRCLGKIYWIIMNWVWRD